MRAGLISSIAALWGCEAAIDMRLELPLEDRATLFNVNCVTAVQVFARGNDRGKPDDVNGPGRPADDLEECITIAGTSSYAKVRDAIAGRFRLDLPESGLAGVDIRGSTGTCKKDNAFGDTIFYGGARYDGGDELVIPMVPNLRCGSKRPEDVRPVDMLELHRTGECPPPIADSVMGGVDSITLHPSSMEGSSLDYNNDFANLVGGVGHDLPLYIETADESCIALTYWDIPDVMYAASCVRRKQGVCSPADQIELPIINYYVAYESANIPVADQYGGWVIGGVWGTNATGGKIPLPGATVRPAKPAESSLAKVVYADLPANVSGPRELPGATSTNATGLFIAYVGRPMDFIVSAPGHVEETVRMGSPDEPSTALIFLQRPSP